MTMEDIATLAGCARSTVHAVISDKPWVSQKTREKVIRVITENNWKPNRLASGLSNGKTGLIAFILKDLQNPFNSQIIEGAESILSDSGYSCLLMSTADDHNREINAVNAALSYNVDGIIITPQQVDVNLEHLWRLKGQNIPFVSLGKLPGILTSYVELNEYQAAQTAVKYLTELGHSYIIHLRGPSTSMAAAQRAEGFRASIIKAGKIFSEDMIVNCGSTTEEGRQAALKILSDNRPLPTAVFCYNDLSAAGVYMAAAETGLTIPDDISVISVDNISLSAVFGPPLTTISQPCRRMGEALASILLKTMTAENSIPTIEKQFLPELIIRQSVKNLLIQE